MNKITFKLSLALVLLMLSLQMKAQLLVENFDYTVGTLLTANGWAGHSGSGTNDVAVVASSISYPNYASSGIGGEVKLLANGQDVNRTFAQQTSGIVYVAFLANVTAATANADYFLHLGQTTIGTTFKGKVFVKKGAEDKIAFGVSHSNNTGYFTDFVYDLNTTYLIVLKYQVIEGATNDKVYLFINGVPGSSEPVSGWLEAEDTAADFANIGSVAIRQGTAGNGLNVIVDGIRVATAWGDAVAQATTIPKVGTPTFDPIPGNILTPQNVTIATGTEGATIYYTTDGSEPDNTKTVYSGAIAVSATTTIKAIAYKDGMDASSVATATYSFPVEVADIAALRASEVGTKWYKLTGEAVVTLKSSTRNAKYIQDATGAVLVDDVLGVLPAYNVGDGVSGIVGSLALYAGMLQFTPQADVAVVTSTGKSIEPKLITIDEMATHQAQLVKLSNVTITGEGNFVASTNYTITSGEKSAVLRTQYDDLNYIGQPIPTLPQDITGVVVVFNTANQIVPRSLTDFVVTSVAQPRITSTVFVENGRLIVNADVADVLEVYNAVGQKLTQQRIVPGVNVVDVAAKGMLVVKLSNSVVKVVL